MLFDNILILISALAL